MRTHLKITTQSTAGQDALLQQRHPGLRDAPVVQRERLSSAAIPPDNAFGGGHRGVRYQTPP